MKVSKQWLKELVDLKVSDEELIDLLPLRTIAINEVTPEYLELDMKGYNRADLLALRGVAFEVAAISDSPIRFTETDPASYAWADKTNSFPPNGEGTEGLKVTVENLDLTPVY